MLKLGNNVFVASSSSTPPETLRKEEDEDGRRIVRTPLLSAPGRRKNRAQSARPRRRGRSPKRETGQLELHAILKRARKALNLEDDDTKNVSIGNDLGRTRGRLRTPHKSTKWKHDMRPGTAPSRLQDTSGANMYAFGAMDAVRRRLPFMGDVKYADGTDVDAGAEYTTMHYWEVMRRPLSPQNRQPRS